MGEVKILDPAQVYLDYGFEIPQGYQLKLTPTVTGQDDFGNPTYDYGISYLTPDSWEITTDGIYTSPDGEQTNEQGYYSWLWNQQYQQAVAAAPEGFEFVASNSGKPRIFHRGLSRLKEIMFQHRKLLTLTTAQCSALQYQSLAMKRAARYLTICPSMKIHILPLSKQLHLE